MNFPSALDALTSETKEISRPLAALARKGVMLYSMGVSKVGVGLVGSNLLTVGVDFAKTTLEPAFKQFTQPRLFKYVAQLTEEEMERSLVKKRTEGYL